MSDVQTLLPSNATKLERQIDVAVGTRLDALQIAISALWAADEALEDHLPWLAWTASVDVWKAHWPLETKRKVILASFEVHRFKGTVGSVRRALDALGVRTVIREWFKTGGDPYTFEIIAFAGEKLDPTADTILNQDFYDLLRDLVDAIKPVRSQFALQLAARCPMPLTLLAATKSAATRLAMVAPASAPITPRQSLTTLIAARAVTVARHSLTLGDAA
jgi:phage tail P2-like protein